MALMEWTSNHLLAWKCVAQVKWTSGQLERPGLVARKCKALVAWTSSQILARKGTARVELSNGLG